MGIVVGGWHLQRFTQRGGKVVFAGGDRRELLRREEVFDDRRRSSRVYSELARGVAGSEGAWDERAEACGRRRCARVLVGAR